MAVRVTRVIAEVAGTVDRSVRVTRTIAEVAGKPAQPDVRLYRLAVMALVDISDGINETAADTVTFTQATGGSFPYALEDTVTFSQTASQVISFQPVVEQTATFSQTTTILGTISESLSNAFTFSQTAISSLKTLLADDTVTFSQLGAIIGTTEETVSQTVTFTHSVSGLFPQVASNSVTFSASSGAGLIIPGGIVVTALTGTVTFSQSVQKVHIKDSATDLTADAGTVTFGHVALRPRSFSIPQSFVLTQTAVPDYIDMITQTVTFSQVLSPAGSVWPRTITHTLSFSHSHIFENTIDLCRYSPTIGGGTDPNAPTPPPATFGPITKESQVTLFFPTTSPTSTVTIRAPEYGDRQKLTFDRVNRESRGGTLEIFADPEWPKMEIIEASFTGLKEVESQAVLDFFALTLGLTIGFTDWHGRTWHGVIVTPDAQLIRARRGIVDMSFEFEGEVQ